MNILQINKYYTPDIGGVESVVQKYSEYFAKVKEIKVTVLCINKYFNIKTRYENINNVYIIRVSSFGSFFSMPLSISFFYYFIRIRKKYDIIHFHEPFPLGSLLTFLVPKKTKLILTWHSDIIKQKKLKKIIEFFQHKLCKRTNLILTTSSNLLSSSSVISHYKYKTKVLPLSISSNVEKGTKHKDDNDNYILYLGRISYYKGIEVLLKAYTESNTSKKLIIVGDGDKNIINSINSYKSASTKIIEFINRFVSEDEKMNFLKQCSFFVFPSIQPSEAFGIIQLEAMLMKKPVINTSLPTGVPLVSLHKETGLTVEPGNVNELSSAIDELSFNPSICQEYGRNARNRVIKYFSDDVVLPQLNKYYESLLQLKKIAPNFIKL